MLRLLTLVSIFWIVSGASRRSLRCSSNVCLAECSFGFEKDKQGCDTCRCKWPSPSPTTGCPNECEHGYEVVDGSPTCQCKTPQGCSLQFCRMMCTFGYEQDEQGCNMCSCKAPTTSPTTGCPNECEDGYQVVNGSPTCHCKAPQGCLPVNCIMLCPFGFEVDANGCDICACASSRDD